jgi:hypothetical protein
MGTVPEDGVENGLTLLRIRKPHAERRRHSPKHKRRFKNVKILVLHPGSQILIFIHPGSRIQQQQKKRRGEKIFVLLFFATNTNLKVIF